MRQSAGHCSSDSSRHDVVFVHIQRHAYAGLRLGAKFIWRKIIDVDQVHDFAIVGAQPNRFVGVDDADRLCFENLSRQIQGVNTARLHALDANALLETLGTLSHLENFLQQAESITLFNASVNRIAETISSVGR